MFHRAGPNRPHAPSSRWHEGVLPRDAFFAPKEAISADDAIGRIAAEQITPAPAGHPVIIPGERITAELLEYLRSGLGRPPAAP